MRGLYTFSFLVLLVFVTTNQSELRKPFWDKLVEKTHNAVFMKQKTDPKNV